MLVTSMRDVGGGRIIEQGAEAAVVVHADVALEVLERALFIRTLVGPVMGCRFDLGVFWRFHGPKVVARGEAAVKHPFTGLRIRFISRG